MRYFKIDIKRFYKNDMVATNANGDKILNGSSYFWKMDKGELIQDAPLFDYFYLESFDEKKHWEWQINDVHHFIGEGSQIPGWLISVALKELLIQFNIAKPCAFYASKLLFKEEKQDYYIFHFSGDKFLAHIVNHVNFNKSLFFDPNQKINFEIKNLNELIFYQKRILKESGYDVINVPVKRLVLNSELDFFPMQSFLKDNIVSERLMQAIEENGITGFEFSELDYEVVVDKEV